MQKLKPAKKPVYQKTSSLPYYVQQVGTSFSRTNYLRPADATFAQFHVASLVFFISVGVIFYWGAFPVEDWLDSLGSIILGALLVLCAGGSVLALLRDSNRSRQIAMLAEGYDKKTMLQMCPKSYRYQVSSRHLRGMKIGACFFGTTLLVFAIANIFFR